MIRRENLSPNLSSEGRKSANCPGQVFMALTCAYVFFGARASGQVGTGFSCPGQVCKTVPESAFVVVKLSRTGGDRFRSRRLRDSLPPSLFIGGCPGLRGI